MPRNQTAQRFVTGTHGPAVHNDHVQQHFTAQRPDLVWLTDIAERPTSEGKVCCCAIKDLGVPPACGESATGSSATRSTSG